MRISEKALNKLKEFEGFSNKAYRCPAGVWTCGFGHTKGVTAITQCTSQEAEKWLLEDLQEFERYVNAIEEADTQGKFDALVDFAFNLGIDNLRDSTLLTKIRAKVPTSEIQREFKRWVYAGKKVLPGLVKRREWEAQRWTEKD